MAAGGRAAGSAHERYAPGAHHLHHAVALEQFEDGVDLVLGAGDLNDEGFGVDVDDLGSEDVRDLDDQAAAAGVGLHLEEGRSPQCRWCGPTVAGRCAGATCRR